MASLLLLQKQSSTKISDAFKKSLIKPRASSTLLSKNSPEPLNSIHKDMSHLYELKLKNSNSNLNLNLNSNHFNLHPVTKPHLLKMYVTVDTKWVTKLRQLMMNTFSNAVSSIRIEPINHAKKMKVCLCFDGLVEDKLMVSIMRTLPSAEFGRITFA